MAAIYKKTGAVDEVLLEQLRFLMLHKSEHRPSDYCSLCGRLETIKILLLKPFQERTIQGGR